MFIFAPKCDLYMRNKFNLPNRYKEKNYLERVEGDKFKLVLQDENSTYGVSYNPENENDIKSVDPSGGPYIYVGYEVDENIYVRKIERTPNGILFTIN